MLLSRSAFTSDGLLFVKRSHEIGTTELSKEKADTEKRRTIRNAVFLEFIGLPRF
jgi:hypothetical protein